MSLKQIYILTGEKNSGKTSLLQELLSKKENCSGILQVTVNNKRFLYNISNKKYYALETEENSDTTSSIGRFHFSKSVFFRANNEILSTIRKSDELIIIDEVGPLELQEGGHYDLITNLLKLNAGQKLLFVIRANLLDLIIQKFRINPIQLFKMPLSKNELMKGLDS